MTLSIYLLLVVKFYPRNIFDSCNQAMMSASCNSEDEEVSSHNIEVLQDVTRRVKEVYDILNRETNRVCKEMEARHESAKKLEQSPFSKILKLNVGGHIFTTSLATLNNAPSGNFTEIVTFSTLNVYYYNNFIISFLRVLVSLIEKTLSGVNTYHKKNIHMLLFSSLFAVLSSFQEDFGRC